MKGFVVYLIGWLGLCLTCLGEEWTSADGKSIEAEFLRLDEKSVVLEMDGREFVVPLERLIEADQEKARTLEGQRGLSVLYGQVLKPGHNEVVGELSAKTLALFSKHKHPVTGVRIVVYLPEGFDRLQPQKILWPGVGLNNEAEWKKGAAGSANWYKSQLGETDWVVIGANTNQGNPTERKGEGNPEATAAFNAEVLAAILKMWPEMRGWKHVTAGFSAGGKQSYYRLAHFLQAEIPVTGLFLCGVNQCLAEGARESYGLGRKAFRDIPVFFSTGETDKLVPEGSLVRVMEETKDAGFGPIRSESYPGGHVMNFEHLKMALDWFSEM